MKEQHKKESPILSLLGMGGGGTGTALAGVTLPAKTYVDDVFSTFLYSPSATQTQIQSGIDFSGEGGMIWKKSRSSATGNSLYDTERGNTKTIYSNLSQAGTTSNNDLISFNSNGVTWDTGGHSGDYVNWSFRKAPGFFDVVTWTGSGSDQTISHNLGSVPGCIMVKCTSHTSEWYVYHRSLPTATQNWIRLSNTAAANGPVGQDVWGPPSSTTFKADTYLSHSTAGRTYVAYVFAHDSQVFGTDEDESIVKCGTFSTDSNGMFDVNLGWEPQWLLIKRHDGSSDWRLFDVMRGMSNRTAKALESNTTDVEETRSPNGLFPTTTGFRNTEVQWYGGGDDFIYMAIRRPHKPPTAGTDVFQSLTYSGTGADITRSTNILVDLLFTQRTTGGNPYAIDRMRGPSQYIGTDSTSGEGEQSSGFEELGNNYIEMGSGPVANSGSSSYLLSMFKRAPGFLDVVGWVGNASGNRAIPHALGVTPELLILKRQDNSDQWWVQYTSIFGSSTALALQSTSALSTGVSAFSNTSAATASNFYIGSDSSVNGNNEKYFAYLFATLTGISKVGTYTGTANAINIPCGFTNGARFVLIKRTDGTGDWYIWDSVRGISSGNDPYILLNNAAAQVTNTDYIDPLSSGFTVTASAPASINANGGNYLFLAIA